jgi:plasmid stabilization system protein ParE
VSLQLIVSREAQADIREAVAYFPELYPLVYKDFRRALLHRFPYSVFYVVSAPIVLVVGVVHQARDEETWKRRA